MSDPNVIPEIPWEQEHRWMELRFESYGRHPDTGELAPGLSRLDRMSDGTVFLDKYGRGFRKIADGPVQSACVVMDSAGYFGQLDNGVIGKIAPMRRVKFVLERESTVEIDEESLVEFLGEEMSVQKTETALRNLVAEGDTSIESIAEHLAARGAEYDRYHHIELYAELEQRCPNHPDYWYALNPTRSARCVLCANHPPR